MLPTVQQVIKVILDVVTWFSNLDSTTKGIILTIAGVLAVVFPLITWLGTLVTALVVSDSLKAMENDGLIKYNEETEMPVLISTQTHLTDKSEEIDKEGEVFHRYWIDLSNNK